MPLTRPDRKYPRAYVKGGHVSHLLREDASLNNASERAMCGLLPAIGEFWYGSGTWDEIERVASMAICLNCERAWRRPS